MYLSPLVHDRWYPHDHWYFQTPFQRNTSFGLVLDRARCCSPRGEVIRVRVEQERMNIRKRRGHLFSARESKYRALLTLNRGEIVIFRQALMFYAAYPQRAP